MAGAATRQVDTPGGVGLNPAPSSFIPNELAAQLQAARASRAMVGERRVVTMLFCDVKGSTAAAEQLDPEEWTDIMNGAFEHMIRPVYDYEGTVARLMGDAILAFFGAPIAHEDDAERAVRAGLEIVEAIKPYRAVVQRDWGLDFDVRVGINTGLVVVGPVGSDLRMEYTALGDAINLAARMEQTALPGTVQIAEPTCKLVAPLFEFEELGGQQVRGKAEPVPAYRVLRLKQQRGHLRGVEGLDSPLVGRDAELAALDGALVELQHGLGQVVSIIGEAGLGKSRLMAELRARRRAEARSSGEIHWLEGRCLSYQTTTPYAPFVDLFTSHFGLRDATAESDSYPRLAQQVAAAGTDRASEIAPFLATLLRIELSGEAADLVRYLEPAQLHGRIHDAVRAYLGILAVNAPLVLTMDDLHWSDPASIELLASLLPLVAEARLMIVAVFRPQAPEVAWRFHEMASRDYAQRRLVLTLKPLDEAQARELVANLLQIEDLPAKARQLILDKAEGNPFFVEEVIRSLLDSGLVVNQQGQWRATQAIENIAVPDTLAAVINARLDRLDDDTRGVVQSAAVIGREFSLALLKAMHPPRIDLEPALAELQRRELVREQARAPESVYTFKHALTQETAYNSLLLKTRRELHLCLASAIETVYASTLQAHTPELAHHTYQAGLWPEALHYSQAAGEHALRLYAPYAAVEHLTHALDAARRLDPPMPAALYLARARAHQLIGVFEPALADLEAGLQAARAAGDQRAEWEALLAIGLLWTSRDYAEAERHLRQALELARALDDARAMGHSLNRLGNYLSNLDRPEEALAYHREALKLFEQLQDQRGLAETHDLTATALNVWGDWAEAAAHYQQAVTHFRALDDRQGLVSGLGMWSCRGGAYVNDAAAVLATPAEAQRDGQAALDLARQTGQRAAEAFAASLMACCLGPQGEYARALELVQHGLALAQEIDHRHWTCLGRLTLGALCLDLLAWPAALEQLQQAQALAGELGSLFFSRMATAFLVSTYTLAGDLAQAEATFNSAVDFGPPARSSMQRQVWAARAELALAKAETEQALQIVEQLLATSPGRLARGEASIPRLAWLRGRALLAQGRRAEAEAELRAAASGAAAHGFRPLRWRILADLARVHLSQGNSEAAASALGAARSLIEALGAPLPEAGLRQRFIEKALAGLPAEPAPAAT